MPVAIFLDAAVALFKRYRWLLAILPLAIGLGLQTWRVNHVKHDLTVARATIAKMEQASQSARQAQLAANLATEARYRAQAEKADHDSQVALADAHAAAARYIAANRVRTNGTDRTSGASSAAQGDFAQGGHGPGSASVMVSEADILICTDNTARLDAVKAWGDALGN